MKSLEKYERESTSKNEEEEEQEEEEEDDDDTSLVMNGRLNRDSENTINTRSVNPSMTSRKFSLSNEKIMKTLKFLVSLGIKKTEESH